MKRLLVAVCLAGASVLYAQNAAQPDGWQTYAGGAEGRRFSPLTQINTTNVSKLKLAWQYGVAGTEGGSASVAAAGRSQAVPIVVRGVLYTSTARRTIVALDPATGKEIWKYDYAALRLGTVKPDYEGTRATPTLEGLARLLHLSAGVVRLAEREDGRRYRFRAAGSAGGQFPFELYVAARDVAGLADGTLFLGRQRGDRLENRAELGLAAEIADADVLKLGERFRSADRRGRLLLDRLDLFDCF